MIQIAVFFCSKSKIRWPRWVGAPQQSDPHCNSAGSRKGASVSSMKLAADASNDVIETTGEVFPGGPMIEMLAGAPGGDPRLLLWSGKGKTIESSRVEYKGQQYRPVPIERSIARELVLPSRLSTYGSTRDLLGDMCKLAKQFVALPDQLVGVVGRLVLDTWTIEAFPVAPALVVNGPDTVRGEQLMSLLHCFCRHGLRTTGMTPAGFCSLPSGFAFTILLSQSTISGGLQRLLGDTSCRDQRIPRRGVLLDLYGTQVIHSESTLEDGARIRRLLEVPMPLVGVRVPILTQEKQRQIRDAFQPKLLAYRCENFAKACDLQFDASKLSDSLRPLARTLAAATPTDADLQAQVLDLLRDEDRDARSKRWTDLCTVVIETILFHCAEAPDTDVYVGDLVRTVQEILRHRGEQVEVDPGAIGKKLKMLGFITEPRDSKGVRLHLSEQVRQRAQHLAHEFEIPEDEAPSAPANGKKGKAIWST